MPSSAKRKEDTVISFDDFDSWILPNSHPDDYYGTVTHQKDLCLRLGLNPQDWDRDDPAVIQRFGEVFLNAQLMGKDAQGNRLEAGDMVLLLAITGRG